MQPVVAFFTELFGDGEIVSNPAARLKRLKEKRVAEIAPFSEAETAILFKDARKHYPHYADYIEHNFESGFRLEENNGLLWPRVNFVSETIAIREARVLGKQKEPKTEGAIRDAEITEGMMRCLKRQKARSYLRHEHVWVTEKGRPIDVSNFRSEVWVPLLKLAGTDYRYPNQARHTFATRHIKRGTDPRWICKQMGTSLEMLFDTYTAEFDRARGDDGHKRGHKAVSRAVKK
jgi:integrase